MVIHPPADSPFHPENVHSYQGWRAAKLRSFPTAVEELLVPVADPRNLTTEEHTAILDRVRRCNMAIYVSGVGGEPDKAIPRRVGEQFGLRRLDHNFLADEDAISAITVNAEGEHPHFIPYTDRPIKWHTDGYYTVGAEKVRGLVLHCVHPAAEGGVNALMDHEILYLLMRDRHPEYVRALMKPDLMTIPARVDEEGVAREEVTGSVFSVDPSGALHMRYTARRRNIRWADDPLSREAVACLETLLEGDSPYIFRATLQAGWGLICNNVLHDRTGFRDLPGHPKRLLYRARYYDRIAGS